MKKLPIFLLLTSISLFGNATNFDTENETKSNCEACDAKWKVEGINDAKGEYTVDGESWTIHFAEDGFIAFHTADGHQDDAMAVHEIVAISKCKFSVMMEGISGEMVPSWTLVYNESENYYDLHVHDYNAETDTWFDKIYAGSSDNG
jgi:hypothetical protein